ncbi:MAG: diguanylate cyclase [Chloroflexi bacterium]|nr:diguanylate cyclase [Chloroflexota bacterium]
MPDMSVYALFPLIATLAYIPLLVVTISSRPWRRQHRLFFVFLILAMLWSLTGFIFRSNFFPQYNLVLLKAALIVFTAMAVQFHIFSSSFYAPGESRWLPFAYASAALAITAVLLGYVPEGITVDGDKVIPEWGWGILFVVLPLLTLAIRNVYVFWRRLRILDNPVLYNQIVSLLFGLFALIVFALFALLPWGKEVPIYYFGSIINAAVLSYAIMRHKLLDLRIVLGHGLAWCSIGVIGVVSYYLLGVALLGVFGYQFDMTMVSVGVAGAIIIAAFVYSLRGSLLAALDKAFHIQTYEYRQRLYDFADKIHNVFSLKEQGEELSLLLSRALAARAVSLLFPEVEGKDFVPQQLDGPDGSNNFLASLRLDSDHPVVRYLGREQKIVTRENLAILPEFRELWQQEGKKSNLSEVELVAPLISRDRLIGIVVVSKRRFGRYSLEDFNLLEDVTIRVSVSMEKEYLREQLREREEELSIINRCSTIITSSLDIQRIYDSFIEELKKIVDVSWAAVTFIEKDQFHVLALSSEIGSTWQVGERVPIAGTGTEWVAAHGKSIVESDISLKTLFVTGGYHLKRGVRSLLYLPLISKGEVVGAIIVASCKPNAYSQRHIRLLEQLASQIAMPIQNSQIYAQAEEKARIDALTGLHNRRSLDETMVAEISRHTRNGGVFSLIICDLDSFKAFNDNNGHLAGDRLLKQIGTIMRNSLRGSDYAFRHGGDEFSILLPETAVDAAFQVAERIRKQVFAQVRVDDIPVSISLGLASWPTDGTGPTEIIAAADVALYAAKRGGGNQCHRSAIVLPAGVAVSCRPRNNDEAENAIFALAAAVDARDHGSGSHSRKVNECAVLLSEALNLSQPEVNRLSTCALLHDIGKVAISNAILGKPEKLTDAEWDQVRKHAEWGALIVSHAPGLVPCISGVLHHHEWYDGSGYPKGLKGEKIPLEARILAIAEAFATITSERSYSIQMSYEEALAEIERGSGKQFDPRLTEAFVNAMKKTLCVRKSIMG